MKKMFVFNGLWDFWSVFFIAFLSCTWGSHTYAQDRIALVIGNSAYRTSPLDNPRNDADAMAALLTEAGFVVDKQLDTNLTQLQSAVDHFGLAIKDPKVKFGLFYYAGHGLQQDWRNYLIPVSASIRVAADVPKQTVDVSSLLRYMEAATGRSFLVVLDACRDDPFAGSYRPATKGLSQFDAPVGSLLAFATSPGSVAQDGFGKNGLYTSHLLREFAVRGTRIEDAFKRVRLNVRLASKGRQIPWESTSLEDDVYLFPTEHHKLSESEKDKLLEQEMNAWLSVKSSADPEVLGGFIRQYPSGSASELAQSRMNRLLATMAAQEHHRLHIATQNAMENAAQIAAEQARQAQALVELQAAEQLRAQQAEQQRFAAERVEQARATQAALEAARQEALRLRAQQEATARAEAAKLASEQARLAALDAQRLAAEVVAQLAAQVAQAKTEAEQLAQAQRQQAERVQAERVAAQQVEAARQSQQQAAVAQAELQRVQAEQARVTALLAAQEQVAQTERMVAQEREAKALLQAAAQAAVQALVNAKVQAALSIETEVTERIELVATPFYKGYAEHQRSYSLGDEFNIHVVDLYSKAIKPLFMKVTQLDKATERVVYNDGEFVSDLMGNTTTNQRGSFSTPRQFYPADLFVGKKWTTRFKQSRPGGVKYTFDYALKVVSKERITVPAGTFEAFKIEARGFNVELGAYLERNIWVTPGINADIAHEIKVRLRNGTIEQNDRQELVSFVQAVSLKP